MSKMSGDLLDIFIEKDDGGAVPRLQKALENQETELNFNLFDFSINYETGIVEIVDVCHLFTTEFVQEFPLDSVMARIKKIK